jgi:glutamyl/glutaminyl-tRNA synthetase
VPFGPVTLWIEQDDFRLDPPPKYFRLTPGREVRLRAAYLVTCTDADTDADGNVTTVYCTHDPESRGGTAPDGRKVKSTMHWVSAAHALEGSAMLYDRLFSAEVPGDATGDPMDDLNVASREILTGCRVRAGAGRVLHPATSCSSNVSAISLTMIARRCCSTARLAFAMNGRASARAADSGRSEMGPADRLFELCCH